MGLNLILSSERGVNGKLVWAKAKNAKEKQIKRIAKVFDFIFLF
jgi:hypothetical protein